MKSWIAFVLIAGCSSKPAPAPDPGSASAAAPAPAADQMCALGKEAVNAFTTCAGKPLEPNVAQGKQQLLTVIDMATAKAANADLPTACAQLVRTFDDELAKIGCQLPLSPGTRTHMYDLIERWYAVRTKVVATGNAPADAKMQQLAGIRDAACACKTAECLDAITKQVDDFGSFGSDAPASAIELAGKLFDDVKRCDAAITKPVKRHD